MLQLFGLLEIPFVLSILIIVSLGFPSLIVILIRILFYQKLKNIEQQTSSLLNGELNTTRSYDTFIAEIEDYFQQSAQESREEVNTVMMIQRFFNQQTIPILGVRFDWADYTTQYFPNVILFLGTIGILLGMAGNLYVVMNNPGQAAIAQGNLGLGIAFLTGFLAFVLSMMLISINLICNINPLKERIYRGLLLHLDRLSHSFRTKQ